MLLTPEQINYRAQIQAGARAGLAASLTAGNQGPILLAATGFGKTYTAAAEIAERVAAGQRVGFLAHLDQLLTATARRLSDHGIEPGWVWAGRPRDPRPSVQLLSTATAIRRLDDLPALDLLVIDECHRNLSANLRIIEALGSPPRIGLTATPARLDGRSLREGGYDDLVRTPDSIDLIEAGLLAPLRIWSWPGPAGLSGMAANKLDSPTFTGGLMAGATLLGDAFAHWAEHSRGRPTVAFCAGVAAAEATAAKWKAEGFSAMAVSAASSAADRERAEGGLRDGQLDLVACADLWVAGVDVADIGCVICLRPTASLVVWLQLVGRGLRLSDAWPDCHLADHAGNCRRPGLGHPLGRRMHLWGLDAGQAQRIRESCPLVSACGQCFSTWVVNGRCQEPGCGWVRAARLPHGPRIIPGELWELDPRVALLTDRERETEKRRQEQKRRNAEVFSCWVPGNPEATRRALLALAVERNAAAPGTITNPGRWAWAQLTWLSQSAATRRSPASRARRVQP